MNKKRLVGFILTVLFFLVLSYAFVPQVLGGKIVNQSDITGYSAMAHEMNSWNSAHPEDPTSWTNAMFGGMPTTTVSAPRQGDWTQYIYDFLLIGKRPATYLFISLLGAFLLMLSLGIEGILAIGGAIAVSFCSYNFQIIQVGHNTKMQAIAFAPWVLAACIFTYRCALEDKRKRGWLIGTLLGAVLFACALSFQIKANHQQITYYLAIIIVIYALSLLVGLLKDRSGRLGRFAAASALLLVIGCAGIATNANKLIPVYKYTSQSTRGGSELASKGESAGKGLELDYATAWSYGWEELPNLMIPNYNGGSSAGAVNINKSATYKLLRDAGYQDLNTVSQNLPLYWGPQPFTAGPMYMGAITVFLFVLGLFLCDGKRKWWLVICTLLAILLALGNHLLWFTKLFYDYAPMYNKFRTVSMALVVLQITLPVLGFVTLNDIVKGDVSPDLFKKKGLVALAITGGFCLVTALFPGLAGTFVADADGSYEKVLLEALVSDRIMLLRSDALRSLLLIAVTYVLLIWGYKEAGKKMMTAAALICLLVLADMFSVGKRYLNSGDFVTPRAFNAQFDKRPVDEIILEDTALSYRVLDLSSNTFNDSFLPYWHKSIGGYSPAKLQRYQELIDRYVNKEMNSIISSAQGAATVEELEERLPQLPVLSALNMKYIIVGADNMPIINNNALGNAWLVDSAIASKDPDQSLNLIGITDLRQIAVLENGIEGRWNSAPGDTIALTYYAPNELHYRYNCADERLAVFSEIYYPEGWHAWIADSDESMPQTGQSAAQKKHCAEAGTRVEIQRADWMLRAAVLPAGEHTLVMRFDPESVSSSATISRISSIFIIILLILAGGVCTVNGKKDGSQS